MAAKKNAVARETSPISAAPSAETSLSVVVPPDLATRKELEPGGVNVWMPLERAGGAIKFGELLPGVVYAVSPKEAHRLVTVKGFRFAAPDDQRRVSDWVDHIADIPPATTAAPAADQE